MSSFFAEISDFLEKKTQNFANASGYCWNLNRLIKTWKTKFSKKKIVKKNFGKFSEKKSEIFEKFSEKTPCLFLKRGAAKQTSSI